MPDLKHTTWSNSSNSYKKYTSIVTYTFLLENSSHKNSPPIASHLYSNFTNKQREQVLNTSVHEDISTHWLTTKQMKMHECIISIVATDALVLKH